ncbi:MAG: PilN domain-containing protein [bacterium]|nr:PilN domain-containing protein [bacterium]
MIRINLLVNRRVIPAPAAGAQAPTAANEPLAPTMGVGFDELDTRREEYYPVRRTGLNAFRVSLVVAGVLIVGMVVWSFLAGGGLTEERDAHGRLEGEITDAKGAAPDLESLEARRAETSANVMALQRLAEPGGAVERYIGLLNAVNAAVPKREVWLTEVRERGGSVDIRGNTYSDHSMATILDELLKSPNLSGVKPLGAKSVDLGGMKVLQFEFSARLD